MAYMLDIVGTFNADKLFETYDEFCSNLKDALDSGKVCEVSMLPDAGEIAPEEGAGDPTDTTFDSQPTAEGSDDADIDHDAENDPEEPASEPEPTDEDADDDEALA